MRRFGSPLYQPPLNVLLAIALASILSGIFLVSFIMLLLHVRLRRRRNAPASRRSARQPLAHAHTANHDHDQDRESDLASEKRSATSFSVSSRASLNLEPNRPIFVDVVVVESADGHDGGGNGGGGSQAGLQFILTPPTPGK